MKKRIKNNPDLIIGILFLCLGSLTLFIWIPVDVETGITQKVRSQVFIGDALAPSMAAAIFSLAGLMLTVKSLNKGDDIDFSSNNLKFIASLLLILFVTINIMYWSGSLLLEAAKAFSLMGENREYRNLRDTAPWKYIGYFLGGHFMIFSLISLMEGKFSLRAFYISVASVLVLIAIYDLPFDDLLLPPNGDF